MKKFLAGLTMLLGLSAQVHAAGVNLVNNGSFENPDIKSGTWTVLYDGDLTNWEAGAAGVEVRDNNAGTAYEGSQFIELDTDYANNTNSSITQTLATTAGTMYKLSFAYSGRISQSAQTNAISVFWNGVMVDTVTAIGGATHDWVVYSFLVKGVGNDILTFAANGLDDKLGGSLDAVSVSAVPVPAAAFLFAPALLGFMGLRRKAAKA
jgi:hypothetical protein